MIIDITGIELTPGRGGRYCLGNGDHYDRYGNWMGCCCDECDYLVCCTDMKGRKECKTCEDLFCPFAKKLSWLDKFIVSVKSFIAKLK